MRFFLHLPILLALLVPVSAFAQSETLVDCVLPDSYQERLTEAECRAQKGYILRSGSSAPSSNANASSDPVINSPQSGGSGGSAVNTNTSTGGSSGGINTALLTGWQKSIVFVINAVLVPLLTAIAFIVFLWGVFNYFIWGADSEDKRTEGKTFVMYGIIGFVIIFSLWGIVNVGINVLNLQTGGRPGSLPYPTL